MRRRDLLQSAAALGLLAGTGAGAAIARVPAKAQVVVIGGGFGGATAARYLRLFSQHRIGVVLVEPDAAFVSCPVSNLVIGGSRTMAQITRPYTGLERQGVRVVRDVAQAVDTQRKTVTLGGGASIGYDMLVVSPGVELQFDAVDGLRAAHDTGQVLQAWSAGPETLALRRQLEAMPDGGTFAIAIPEEPYRCPPAPYERVCQVAWYFRKAKPRSKVVVLDANPDITSKGPIFRKAWAELYPGMIDYRPQNKVVGVDGRAGVLHLEIQDDVKADVLNVLPPMRAGAIAAQAGLRNLADRRWCGVDFLTFESTAARDVYVLGDAIQIAPVMPKSGHMANSQAKVAAAAIVARLSGWEPNPAPMLTNTCYSYIDDRTVAHVASVHAYDAAQKTFLPVPGAGGVSAEANHDEARYAWDWARNIWADTLG